MFKPRYVQTPFLGTPLVPTKPQSPSHHSNKPPHPASHALAANPETVRQSVQSLTFSLSSSSPCLPLFLPLPLFLGSP